MNQAFELPSRAGDVGTIDRRFVFLACGQSAAGRTALRHAPRLFVTGPSLRNRSDDLWDHVARPLHLDPIADTEILGDDEILVVQRRQLDDYASDFHRFQHGEGIHRPCTADVDLYRQQSRLGDVGSEFAGDCPPRLAPADDAQLLLKGERIDFYHATVDREVEIIPYFVLEIVRPLLYFGERFRALAVWRYWNTPVDESIEQLCLRLEGKLLSVGSRYGVAKESQGAGGGDRRIELTQTSRSGVARIGENRIARARARLVHLLEAVEREIDLAPDLDPPAGSALVQTERDIAYCAQIQRDVLTDDSISARCAHDENLIFVGQRHRDAVDLQLGGVSRLGDVVSRHADQPLFPRG